MYVYTYTYQTPHSFYVVSLLLSCIVFSFFQIYIYIYTSIYYLFPRRVCRSMLWLCFGDFEWTLLRLFTTVFLFFVNSRSTYNAYANVQFPSVRVLFLAKSFWNKLVKNLHATVQYAVSELFFPIYIVDLQKANLYMLKLKSENDFLQRVFCQRSLSGALKTITFKIISKQMSTILFHPTRNYVPKPVRTNSYFLCALIAWNILD